MARPRRKPARHKAEIEISTEILNRSADCAGCGEPLPLDRVWCLSNGHLTHIDINCWTRAKELPHVKV
jgi:hypothetical protein